MWHNGKRLETENHTFVVGLDYLKLEAAVKELTNAAYAELNEGEGIAIDALSKAVTAALSETVKFIAEKLLPFIPKFGELNEISGEILSDAVVELTDWLSGFSTAIELGTYDRISSFWRNRLDENTFNGRRNSANDTATSLLEYARNQSFTWQPAWQAQIIRRQTAIL